MKKRLLFDLSYASAANYLSEAFYVVRGLVLAGVLGPASFGIWTSMRLVMTLGAYSHLGVHGGMLQRSAYLDGAGDGERAEACRGVAAAVSLVGSVAFAAVLVAIVAGSRGPAALWIVLAVVLVARNGYQLHRVALRSRGSHTHASSAGVAAAALSTVAGLAAALLFGLGGFLVALAGSHVVVLATSVLLGHSFPRPILDRGRAAELIGIGFPIMLSGLLHVVLWNLDKLLLWILAGSVALGTYAIQSYVTAAMMLFPQALSRVLHPHLVGEIGRERSDAVARPYLEQGSILLSLLVCPLVGLLCLTLHLPLRWWLPEYTAAIDPGRILVLATFFPIVATVSATVLVSLGRQRTLLGATLFAVVLTAFCLTWVLLGDGGFVAVALGTALGFVARSALTAIAAWRASGRPSGAPRFVARTLGPYVLLLGLVAAAVGLVPDAAESWRADLLRTALRCAIVVLPTALWAAWSASGIYRAIRETAAKER